MKTFQAIGLLIVLGLAAYGLFVIAGSSGIELPFDLPGDSSDAIASVEDAPPFEGSLASLGEKPEMSVTMDFPPVAGNRQASMTNDPMPWEQPQQSSSTGQASPDEGTQSDPAYAQTADPIGNYAGAGSYAANSSTGQGEYMATVGVPSDPGSMGGSVANTQGDVPAAGQYDSQSYGQGAPIDAISADVPPLPPEMIRQLPHGALVRVGAEPLPELASMPSVVREDFKGFLDHVCSNLNNGQVMPMYEVLCRWYGDPKLTLAERDLLVKVLDQVTAEVVYSPRNYLEQGLYVVQPEESLDMIAERYNVPWELLGKINNVTDPRSIMPGEQLKVISGPFKAVIDLSDKQVVMLLDNNKYYAGRFPIGAAFDQVDKGGMYQVAEKVRNPVFCGADGVAIPPESPENPLAGFWVGFGVEGVGLHATNVPEDIGSSNAPGCICLRPEDMGDLFDMLSVKSDGSGGSFVMIQE